VDLPVERDGIRLSGWEFSRLFTTWEVVASSGDKSFDAAAQEAVEHALTTPTTGGDANDPIPEWSRWAFGVQSFQTKAERGR